MYEYSVRDYRVVDGDTIHATVDLGCDVRINLTLRLAAIDAPERGTPEGTASTAWLGQRLAAVYASGRIIVRTIKDRREKYGRYLAYLVEDGVAETMNDEMLRLGLAVPYPAAA